MALGALCHHNSRHIGLAEGFHESAAVFARKWAHRLPVATPCVIIDREGEVHVLGNAEPGPRSIAYAMEPRKRDLHRRDAVSPLAPVRSRDHDSV